MENVASMAKRGFIASAFSGNFAGRSRAVWRVGTTVVGWGRPANLDYAHRAAPPRTGALTAVCEWAAVLILAERGCGEAQPQRVNTRNSLVLCGSAAAGRDDTAALQVKMRIAARAQAA